MAKKSKEKWAPHDGELAHMARIDGGQAWASDLIYFGETFGRAYRAGLIYRTKRESIACARRMLAAAKQG